jgi:uncharacterized protein YjbJ (UPF0337 family)
MKGEVGHIWRESRAVSERTAMAAVLAMSKFNRRWKMNKEHVKGAADHAKGAVKEGIGKVTGNERLREEGQHDKAKGDIHKAAGDVKDAVKKAAR